MSDFTKLSSLMRADWDRRISHDHRFWMSDGYQSDESMWEAGQRDLEILLSGFEHTADKCVLEVGCGVGRLLRACVPRFKRVIGIDVSEVAIEKAHELLRSPANLELIVGNGYDLSGIADASVDLVISFAAITSVPTAIIAQYLHEMHRVLKPDGEVRLQVYLGKAQQVSVSDTLHLRCFERERFERACEGVGFRVQSVDELRLPFEVSYKEGGIEAVIVSALKGPAIPTSPQQTSQTLLPEGEAAEDSKADPDLECWMSLRYAQELAEAGAPEQARAALEYASVHLKNVTIDIGDMFDRIAAKLMPASPKSISAKSISAKNTAPEEDTNTSAAASLASNVAVLKERFPALIPQLEAALAEYDSGAVEVRSTVEGPSLYHNGQCLDHPTKPVAGAAAWVKRSVSEIKERQCKQLVVFGGGGWYHVEALLEATEKDVAVVEPNKDVFVTVLKQRDLTEVLSRIAHLHIGDEAAPTWLDGESELCIRAQAQAAYMPYCSLLKSEFYSTRGLTALHPMIGILGPLQGGTLPIAAYCSRAMSQLQQRTRELNVSGFAPGYHLVENFVKDDMRKATVQGTYVEMISQIVLESIEEKPIDILLVMAQAPVTARLLTEMRKRGVITILWFVEDYLRFTYWQHTAHLYDFVFTIQKGPCIEAIKAAGAGEVHYLPTGCDPELHAPCSVPQEERSRWGSPVSFVGAGYHNRQQVFASLCEFPLKVWGTEWPQCRPFDVMVQEQARRIQPEEYVKIFNCSDINLNLHSSTERDGIDPYGDFLNPRTFELAAAGAFQLVDERSLLAEQFEVGSEIVTFDSVPDLKDKLAYYLAHPEERAQIAQRARVRALRDHTYEKRLSQMLSIVYNSKYEKLKRTQESSPWSKLLNRAKPHDELHRRCEAAFARGEEPKLDGLVSDIVTGEGELSETEQKLLFLHHIKSQISRMHREGGQ